MKKDFAIFTIVQNEMYFLPKLVKYYSQYVDPCDFYVLDHDTTDGSTDDLNVNVVKVSYEFSFDHKWLVGVVMAFQRKLLQKYKYVIFVEADDFLYTLNNDFLSVLGDSLKTYDAVVNTAYNIVHDFMESESEDSLTEQEFMSSTVARRKFWSRKPNHDKALVVKTPCGYARGFHNFKILKKGSRHVKNPELFLAHLHMVDWELNKKRITHRISDKTVSHDMDVSELRELILLGKTSSPESGKSEIKALGSHNKISDDGVQHSYFSRFIKTKEVIPQDHKDRMIELGI